MRIIRFAALLTIALATCVSAQRGTPPPPSGQPPAGQPPPGGRGGGRGRGGIVTMTFTSSGWSDGGQVPSKYTQVNGPAGEISPPLSWSGAPQSTLEVVLV